MPTLCIESDQDEQSYRIGEGGDPSKEPRIEGDSFDWGEPAVIEVDGVVHQAYVDEDGNFDGFIYGGGRAQPATIETDWDLSDSDDSDDSDDGPDEDDGL